MYHQIEKPKNNTKLIQLNLFEKIQYFRVQPDTYIPTFMHIPTFLHSHKKTQERENANHEIVGCKVNGKELK